MHLFFLIKNKRYVRGVLFGEGRAWKNDIGVLSANITMVTLVDNKGVRGDIGSSDLISVQEVKELGGGLGHFLGRRNETNFICSSSTGSLLRCCLLSNAQFIAMSPLSPPNSRAGER